MNSIIINADDFGFNEDTFNNTCCAFDNGLLTSATIMTGMSHTTQAIQFAINRPEFSFGVHLNFVDNHLPISKISDIKSIVNSNNKFYNSNILRLKSIFKLVKFKSIFSEASNQIEFLLNSGVKISHIDSHGHLHKFPIIREAVFEVSKKYNINKIRNIQNIKNNNFNILFVKDFKKYKVLTTDFMYMPNAKNDWLFDLNSYFNNFKSETIEIGVHPGYDEFWRRNESKMLKYFINTIKFRNDIKFINWNDL